MARIRPFPTLLSLSLPPFVSRRGLSNTNQRLSLSSPVTLPHRVTGLEATREPIRYKMSRVSLIKLWVLVISRSHALTMFMYNVRNV